MKHQNYNEFPSDSVNGFNCLMDMQRKNLQTISAAQRLVFQTMQNLIACQLRLLSQLVDRDCSSGSEPIDEEPPEAKEPRKRAA